MTQEPGFQVFPRISRDGAKLAFLSHAAHNDEVWLLDLTTGKRLLLSTKVSIKFKPILHADGSRVAYTEAGEDALYAVSSSGGPAEKLCERCGWPWDWSADQRRILHIGRDSRGSPNPASMLNLQTGKGAVFVERGSMGAPHQLHWSTDNRWIVFIAGSSQKPILYVAPFSGDQGPPETAWIPITDGSTDEENTPYWSPDGNWIYSVSTRDGYSCLWAYPLDPQTKRPAGKPADVFHSHGSRLSLRNANQVSLELSVAHDKIVFNQGEITGNIWMTTLPAN